MSRSQLLGASAAMVFFVTTVGSTLAGPPAGRGHGAPSAGPGHSSGANHATKAAKGDKDKGVNKHSNKGGKLRGLDRADQVAGEHGKQGRARARANQAR